MQRLRFHEKRCSFARYTHFQFSYSCSSFLQPPDTEHSVIIYSLPPICLPLRHWPRPRISADAIDSKPLCVSVSDGAKPVPGGPGGSRPCLSPYQAVPAALGRAGRRRARTPQQRLSAGRGPTVWNHFQYSCPVIVRAHTWAGTAAPRRLRAGARTAGPARGRRYHHRPGTIRVTDPTLRRDYPYAHES